MERRAEHHAPARLAIGLGVASLCAYEYFCPPGELITEEVRRTRQRSKLANLAVQTLIWTTAAHLSGVYEKLGLEQYDWLSLLGKAKVGRYNERH